MFLLLCCRRQRQRICLLLLLSKRQKVLNAGPGPGQGEQKDRATSTPPLSEHIVDKSFRSPSLSVVPIFPRFRCVHRDVAKRNSAPAKAAAT